LHPRRGARQGRGAAPADHRGHDRPADGADQVSGEARPAPPGEGGREGPPLMEALGATKVSKAYGEIVALRDASISVKRGRAHALAGADGARKSTLQTH